MREREMKTDRGRGCVWVCDCESVCWCPWVGTCGGEGQCTGEEEEEGWAPQGHSLSHYNTYDLLLQGLHAHLVVVELLLHLG